DSQTLATGAFDGRMKLWDNRISKRDPLLRLNCHNDQIMNTSFSPNCVYITTISYDKRIRVWNAFTRES
ncbi:hypothetical protein BGZ57DRAFT_742426, partial [Hyaloscypha finlandica]